jgi:hypothetical protein
MGINFGFDPPDTAFPDSHAPGEFTDPLQAIDLTATERNAMLF